jgi:hypothetical protein
MFIIIHDGFNYKVIEDYIESLSFSNPQIHIYDPNIDYITTIKKHSNTLFLFVNDTFNIPFTNQSNVYMLNVEQLSIPHNIERIQNIPPQIPIIDYNYANILISPRKLLYLPYQYNPSEIYNIEKTQNVTFIGWLNERRIIPILKIPVLVTHTNGFGAERDRILFANKVLVNIHYDENYNVFEEIRCNRCIFNKLIVISEPSIHMEHYKLKKYMIECPLDEIPEMVKQVLDNYEEYHSKLFADFDAEIETHRKYFEECKDVIFQNTKFV